MKKGIAIIALSLIALIASAGAMVLSPSETADAIMAPTIADIAMYKAELVAGNITFDEWKSYMYAKKVELGLYTIVLEAIRDSDRSYNNKMQAVYTLFDYKPIRAHSTGNMPRIIGGAHL